MPPSQVSVPASWDGVEASHGLFSEPDGSSTLLTGNHHFDNFIGWISNPLQNIDPRALTELYPIFGSVWGFATHRASAMRCRKAQRIGLMAPCGPTSG
jgi:hypothetical protein